MTEATSDVALDEETEIWVENDEAVVKVLLEEDREKGEMNDVDYKPEEEL